MSKTIKFAYNGVNYTLEYNRETVRQMENRGFRIDEIDSRPETMVSMLFAGAFLMHHRKVSTNTKLVEEIYGKFTNRDELISTLVKMYQEPILSLFDEPEEDEGNIVWGTD